MKILGIETSCDETAIAVIEADEPAGGGGVRIRVRANQTLSQIELHRQFGGVFPMMAKREHSRTILPLLEKALAEAKLPAALLAPNPRARETIRKILDREPELLSALAEALPALPVPALDAIAVTNGPGLEPALWVGVNFAKALGALWNVPVAPVNHMEGHILVSLLRQESAGGASAETFFLPEPELPALALLISGGHTELVLMKKFREYVILGATRDDAAGEAFDKAARLLGLPYPGGPEISRLAEEARRSKRAASGFSLPRPMISSGGYDFSFSGLKTALRYAVLKKGALGDEERREIAREFEDAVAEVLAAKTERALADSGARTLVVGGGVAANKEIRRTLQALAQKHPAVSLFFPRADLATDNALMIALAGYFRIRELPKKTPLEEFRAEGGLALG